MQGKRQTMRLRKASSRLSSLDFSEQNADLISN